MSVPFYPFYFLPLKLSNKEMNLPLSIKTPKQGKERIFKFFFFYSFPFSPPKRGLKVYKEDICLSFNALVRTISLQSQKILEAASLFLLEYQFKFPRLGKKYKLWLW